MKVIILGTGTSQGIPIIGCKCKTCTSSNPKDKRLRTSAYIEVDGLKLLIDTSVDFRQQMLSNCIDDLDAVLYTHHHVDHILGLDDLRQINQKYDKFIDIYGNKFTIDEIKITFRYAFDKNPATEKLVIHQAVPLINTHYIKNEKFTVKGVEIIPIEIMHGHLPIFGYRIGNFAYITDASEIPETEQKKLLGLDVLILNALRERPHPSHLSIEQAVKLAEKLKAKETYFTHMTHEILHDEVNKKLPENIKLGYDGMSFEIK